MCPPGYHHNGIMAAREIGEKEVTVTHCRITFVESPECSKLRAVSDA